MTIEQNEKTAVLFYRAVDTALAKAGRSPEKVVGVDEAWGYKASTDDILQVHVYTQPLFNLDFLVVIFEYNTEWRVELDVLLPTSGCLPDRRNTGIVNRTDGTQSKHMVDDAQLAVLEEVFIFGKDEIV